MCKALGNTHKSESILPRGEQLGTPGTKLNIDSSCLSLSVFWMPRCPRLCPAGTCFHVINRAVARLTLFEKQEDYVAFERALKLTHERVPLPIYACCRIIGISWFSRKPIRWLLSSFAGWRTLTRCGGTLTTHQIPEGPIKANYKPISVIKNFAL